MSVSNDRVFKFEAQHIFPSEILSGATDDAALARALLADIGFDIEARANKMMLFVSEEA